MVNTTKRIAATAVLALIIATGAMAHPDKTDRGGFNQELVLKNFEHSLQMEEYPGVVESTIYNVVVFKNRFPQLDYARLAASLQRLIEENQDASISYKAQLAYMYLNNSSTIDLSPEGASSSHGYIFKQISEQLEQKFLAAHE